MNEFEDYLGSLRILWPGNGVPLTIVGVGKS